MKLLLIFALLVVAAQAKICRECYNNKCEYGFQIGSDRCPLCELCNPHPVGHALPESCNNRPMCQMHCEFGFQKGDDGCLICKCNEGAPDCRSYPKCLMYCFKGTVKGLDGCPLCKCKGRRTERIQ